MTAAKVRSPFTAANYYSARNDCMAAQSKFKNFNVNLRRQLLQECDKLFTPRLKSPGSAAAQTPGGQLTGTTVYAAMEKKEPHRTVSDLEKKEEPVAPAAGAELGEVMKHRLKTKVGKDQYKLRQQTVEPVFGIIQSVRGFRHFLLRGLEKVGLEWQLICIAYNLKRLHMMKAGLRLAGQA